MQEGAAAPGIADGELQNADAALFGAVVVGVERQADLLEGLDGGEVERVDLRWPGDLERPIRAVVLVGDDAVALHRQEVGKEIVVGPGPLLSSGLVPAFVVASLSSYVGLGVDRAPSADAVALLE